VLFLVQESGLVTLPYTTHVHIKLQIQKGTNGDMHLNKRGRRILKVP
jgi:hypothetical protein